MANGDLLMEIKQYADDEGQALPARLFQRLMLKATAQMMDAQADANKRLSKIEQRHCDEDDSKKKTSGRRWDLVLIGINSTIALGLALLALFK